MNIVKILDTELTYSIFVINCLNNNKSYLGEYIKECDGLKAARYYLHACNDKPISYEYDVKDFGRV